MYYLSKVKDMKKEKLILMFSMIQTILLCMVSVFPVNAQGPIVQFEQANYTFDITLGYKFNVTVVVTGVSKLMMFQVYVTFDDSIINVTQFTGEVSGREDAIRAWPNDDLDGRNWDSQYVFYKKAGGMIGNPSYYHTGPGLGAVKIGDTLFANATLIASNTYKLASIEFNVTGTPTHSCTLGINNVDTFLYDSNGQIADVTKIDSTATIIPEFPLLLMLFAFISTNLIAIALAKKTLRKKQV